MAFDSAFDDYDFLEKAGAESPSTVGASIEGGRVIAPYFFPIDLEGGDPVQALWDQLTRILGGCIPNGDGKLNRSLPGACDLFPWLVAEQIQSMRGFQGNGKAPLLIPSDEDEPLECPPLVGARLIYPYYRADIAFTQRPYRLLSDDSIEVSSLDYYDDDGVPQSTPIANEWDRFCHWSYNPQPDIAFADHGQLVFRTQGGDPPDGATFLGKPRVVIPQAQVQWHWMQVPDTYLESSSSPLISLIGRVNQVEFYGWAAGSLLYTGLTVLKRYTPPVPRMEESLHGVTFSVSRLVDIALMFVETDRETGGGVDDPPAPDNPSWITAGHNLSAWLQTKEFYYVSGAATDPENQLPVYLSSPFQPMFFDPEA